ncbi:MAG TPA: Uma2 family endonuclease [Candidatus Baltobacteraceae bacterium]|jgi:Uma2 family endonuclease|nr:Uma2 family endonuclease [Candidatus Baltobacteraceae bacterium]
MRDHFKPRTLAEFIAWEADQPTKHEFINGQVVLYAGGTGAHSAIAAELIIRIGTHIQRPCRVFTSDLQIETAADAFYADVSVTCDERDLKDLTTSRVLRHPKLLIEVNSPTTRKVDFKEKRDAYLALPSLEEYVLIDSEYRSIEAYQRHKETWFHTLPICEGFFSFTSIGLSVVLDDIYPLELTAARPERKERKKTPSRRRH